MTKPLTTACATEGAKGKLCRGRIHWTYDDHWRGKCDRCGMSTRAASGDAADLVRRVWTEAHRRLLEQAKLEPLPNLAEPTGEESDLVAWDLLVWDAGRAPGHERYGGSRKVRQAGVYITKAGLALLSALAPLDGTAPPSEHLNPGAEKGTG